MNARMVTRRLAPAIDPGHGETVSLGRGTADKNFVDALDSDSTRVLTL